MSELNKVIDKIKKLLAMAADTSSPNEALIAAKRARSLMDKYQLTKLDIEKQTGDQFLESQGESITSKRLRWVLILQRAAANLNDCVAAVTHAPRVKYLFRGFKSDAVVAKLTFDYLIEACNRQCVQSQVKGISEKNFFRLGFADAISRRALDIKSEREQTFVNSSGTALVPLKESMIESHFGKLKPMKSAPRREPSFQEVRSYLKGEVAGNKVSLERQIEGEESMKISSF